MGPLSPHPAAHLHCLRGAPAGPGAAGNPRHCSARCHRSCRVSSLITNTSTTNKCHIPPTARGSGKLKIPSPYGCQQTPAGHLLAASQNHPEQRQAPTAGSEIEPSLAACTLLPAGASTCSPGSQQARPWAGCLVPGPWAGQTQPGWWQGAGSKARGHAPRSMGSFPEMLAAGHRAKAVPVCPPAQGPGLGEEMGPQECFWGEMRGHTLPPIQQNGSEESWRTHRGVKTVKPENILPPLAACPPGSGEICPLSPNDERWKRSRQRSCVSVPTHQRFEACQDHGADLHPIVTGCRRVKTPAALHATPECPRQGHASKPHTSHLHPKSHHLLQQLQATRAAGSFRRLPQRGVGPGSGWLCPGCILLPNAHPYPRASLCCPMDSPPVCHCKTRGTLTALPSWRLQFSLPQDEQFNRRNSA